MKAITPNYEILKQSTVHAMITTYSEWKKAVNDSLRYSWIDIDGNICVLEGQEERNKKAQELWKEFQKLQFKLEEIQNEINQSIDHNT